MPARPVDAGVGILTPKSPAVTVGENMVNLMRRLPVAVRSNEAFELDSEDRGQFGIHDHGFFQMIVGF
jgi:hypothetical protein